MDDEPFDVADEDIADAIAANISYFGDSSQRNLFGLEYVISAAGLLGVIFLHGFLEESGKQAKRIARLSAKKIGDLIAERLQQPKAARERETTQARGKARKLAKQLSPKELDARVADAQEHVAQSLADAGLPDAAAKSIAAKTAASMKRALKSAPK